MYLYTTRMAINGYNQGPIEAIKDNNGIFKLSVSPKNGNYTKTG